MEYILHKSEWKDFTRMHFLSLDGSAYGQLYFYHDDPTTFILCELSISENYRKKGLGTKMQEAREKVAKQMGAKTLNLWVEKESWMVKWYERRGYVVDKEMDDGNHWMKKEV